jgi:hypothetical protein
MSDTTTPITERAKKIGYREFQSSRVGADQQLANATTSIAIQMSLINQKLDLLIEAIERTGQRP